jgi:peptidoglycan/LPS O-acetylase OafA/YrhL
MKTTIIAGVVLLIVAAAVLWNFFANPYRFEDDLDEANGFDDEGHRRP